MELTTDNLIKIIIGVFVIVVVVLGVYFAMKSYVIPYFSGIGFEEPKIDTNTEFGKQLLKDENLIGSLDKDGYFVYQGTTTDIYFKEGKIYIKKEVFGLDWINPDTKIGSLNSENKIIINKEIQYSDALRDAYKLGNEIYKIK